MPLAPGLTARQIRTSRLLTNVHTAGDPDGIPVVLVHGNVSSNRFFDELLLALPAGYYGIAPDLRGYGASETLPVDATRGVRDWSDDLRSLFEAMGLADRPVHLMGWSMGGGVVMQYTLDHPAHVASLTLQAPVSPFGFGGTTDTAGTLAYADGAGSGGGAANPEFVQRLVQKETAATDANSPRAVMNTFYFKPPFQVAPDVEDRLVESMVTTATGENNYPGDLTPSANWPGIAPGTRGVLNTMAPTHYDLSGFAGIAPQPPVLWVRGADDQIVADFSLFDFAALGQLGAVPGWPGADACPPQPMVSQMRAVLDRYRAGGGACTEVVMEECGHSPHIEKAAEFQEAFFAFLGKSR